MTHISSIGAGLFSDLSIAMPITDPSSAAIAALDTATEFDDYFAAEIASIGGTKDDTTKTFVRVKDVREFPSMGTPPNIVNVPVYGSKTSQQIQGQADAPSMELTLNYVAAEWADGSLLGDAVGDGVQYIMRFALLNSEPASYLATAGGMGSVQNSYYYWIGKLEAIQVSPNLTDANQATITLTMQSSFFGPYTV